MRPSWHQRLMKTVKSPKWAPDQIATRVLMLKFVKNINRHPQISNEIKTAVDDVINPKRKRALQVGDVHLLAKGMKRQPTEEERQHQDQ